MNNKCDVCKKKTNILIEKHHIHSKCYGGSNDNANITSICNRCHKLVHHGLIILEG